MSNFDQATTNDRQLWRVSLPEFGIVDEVEALSSVVADALVRNRHNVKYGGPSVVEPIDHPTEAPVPVVETVAPVVQVDEPADEPAAE